MKKIFYGVQVAILLIGSNVFAQQAKLSAGERRFEISKNLDIYNALLRELDMFYVDTIDPQEVITGSIESMLEDIDPYTVYIPEEDTKDLQFMTTGEYGGIGSIISQNKEKETFISEPYEGMPAQKAGLHAGDIILAINGESVQEKTVDMVSDMLRGEAGTEIQITIKRTGEKNEIREKLIREKIQINPVSYYGICGDGKTGYVLLSQFTDKAVDETKAAIIDLKKRHAIDKLILDLRNNGGGLLDQAVEIANLFLPKNKEVLSTRGKVKQWDNIYRTTNDALLPDMALVILVNGNTASASEIVSGAVQDFDRGVIVGTRTFGKGLVQATRELPYNGHLKVTTAKYYTPSGRCIQAIDYAHHNQDRSAERIPDSLRNEFRTTGGRIVRDGGGISPDIEVKNEQKMNISYYLYADNMIFDYATLYATRHKKIADPETFTLTDADYDEFKNFVKEKKFSYTPKSVEYLDKMKEVLDFEGYGEVAKIEFDSLKSKLATNIDRDLDLFRTDIQDLLQGEIMRRYYFQKGYIRYTLKTDPELKKALEILSDRKQYEDALKAPETKSKKTE